MCPQKILQSFRTSSVFLSERYRFLDRKFPMISRRWWFFWSFFYVTSTELYKNRISSWSLVQNSIYKRFPKNIFSVQKLRLIGPEMKIIFLVFCLLVGLRSRSTIVNHGRSRKSLMHETFSKPEHISTTVNSHQLPTRQCAFNRLKKSLETLKSLEEYIKCKRIPLKSVKSFHFLKYLSQQKC